MNNYRTTAETLLSTITDTDDPTTKAQAAQAYATLALAEQIRLQTLLTTRMNAEIADAIRDLKRETLEPDELGASCINAITQQDAAELGISKKEWEAHW